jgi:hypothetical protein
LKPLVIWRPYPAAQVMSFGEPAAKQRTTGGMGGGEVNRCQSEASPFRGPCGTDHLGRERSKSWCWRRERHPAPTFSVYG